MALWFVLTLMTALAVLAVLWPLGAARRSRSGSDVAVYRDQLEELERDRKAGIISEADAEAARVEVARRLIAAADAATNRDQARPSLRRQRAVAVLALLVLPVGAGALYLALGSPHLPAAPLAARLQTGPENRSVTDLVAQVEAHLQRSPEDGRGWEVLAPVYMRLGRYEDAVKARRNSLRLNGATAARESDYGEALTAAASGIVTADAKAAFDRAMQHDPEDFKARYFLGLAAEQDGRPTQAATIWRRLLAGAPADAPWRELVQRSLERVDPRAAALAAPGPSAEDVAAAANLSPEQRMTMVRGMVERLAARLRQDASDVEGWLRLLRAHMVLGETDKAKAAAADARRALANDAVKLGRLTETTKALGLEGTER
jgi:cytochrome c-type biogenesis protein CcmH